MRQAAQLLRELSCVAEAQQWMVNVMPCMRVFALANVLALLVGRAEKQSMHADSLQGATLCRRLYAEWIG
jgi:hypothetical protein